MLTRRSVSALLIFALYFSFVAQAAVPVQAQVLRRTLDVMTNNTPTGLTFRLSDGTRQPEVAASTGLAPAAPLSQSEKDALLRRIPKIADTSNDQTDFAKRAGTLPPPKAGTRVSVKFPSDQDRALPNAGNPTRTLQVLRWSPEGEVPLAPDLSVTFSQPMIAVSSQEEAAKTLPVELSPQVAGNWRWLGTKTLMFDAKQRFPMATKFTARVPGGTLSANGERLGKDFTWTFTTPPPKVENSYPSGTTVKRDALIYVAFDQEINPEAVLRTISVTAGGRRIATRLATETEVNSDPVVGHNAKSAMPRRWIALRALGSDGSTDNALPADSQITVTVEKGTPSAEGPLTTVQPQSFSFRTFGPFKFNAGYCGWRQNTRCTPHTQLVMEFNNYIDASKFTKEMVRIEPAVENLNIYPSGNAIYFNGYKKGNTTYTITVDKSLGDTFGQALGKDAVASIRVGPAETALYAQGGFMSVLDPAASRTFSIYSINQPSARLRVHRVRPEDWPAYQQYVRHINYDDGNKRGPIPGTMLADRNIAIASKTDEMVETRIDLTEFLSGGVGHLVIDVEPAKKRDQHDRTRVVSWLQATQIGLDAFVDDSTLVGFATDLRSGRPLDGVELSIQPNGTSGPVSENRPVAEEGLLDRAWNWLTSGSGTSGPNVVESVAPDGTVLETDTVSETQSSRTGGNGIARLELPASAAADTHNVLVAKRGNDVAFLPESADAYWQTYGSWHKTSSADTLRWFVFDDRRMYKPKEEVSIKGYVRKVGAGKFGDVEPLGDTARGITYVVRDPQNNEIGKGAAELNAFGAFDFKFSLPDNVNLGSARVEIATQSPLSGSTHAHEFQIQEFRRPEFEVTSKVETAAPHFVGASAMLSVDAKYYAGGGLANADVNWSVSATPTNYTPPNRDDFTFGTWTPWWYSHHDYYPGGGSSQSFKGKTDAEGRHLLKIDFQSVNPPRPYSVTANSSVQDVNRQTWSSTTSLLVHPSSLYVGIRTPRTFAQKGETIAVDAIATDLDGNLIPGRDIAVKAVLTDWVFDKGSWSEKVVDDQQCEVKSGTAPVKCSFVAKQGGRYKISAGVMDDRERFNQSEITVWVAGGKNPPNRGVEQGTVQLIPSKKEYAPGEAAELLVVSPFAPAEGVLTLRRDGIVKTERFSLKDASTTLRIPIEERYLPNVTAQVDLVGMDFRADDKGEIDEKLPKRPAYASGSINLTVSTKSRRLSVSAVPAEKTLIPGGETKVNVEVTDHNGEPVANSEVAVVVVDESVLALSGYTVGNPADTFYAQRGTGTRDFHSRADVLLANPEDAKNAPPPPPAAAMETVNVSADAASGAVVSQRAVQALPNARAQFQSLLKADGADAGAPIAMRQNFDALAKFAPSVRTDSNGRAVVDLKLPDNLTRYRITAVSVDAGKRFGKAESDITAKQPLMVRPSAPRFMNFGDSVELPVVLQNQTDKDLSVDVAIRATNANLSPGGELADSAGKRVLVKANDRVEVRFPASTVRAGTARFQFAATSGKFSDAAEIELPVWTPATTEAFATYGNTDQNGAIVQPIQAPGDIYPQFGGLEVTTSSTQLQELTDAFLYLANYRYGCSEQISSRMISIAAMRDVLTAFKAKDMPTREQLDAQYKVDIEVLQSRQRDDGSFGLWKKERDRYEYPFLTVHVAHALGLAKAKGYKVPDGMLERTKPYLKNVESHFDEWHKRSPEVRWTISAYALYVRAMLGDRDAAKAKKLLAEATIEKMPFEALGWVLSVLADDAGSKAEVAGIMRHLMNQTTETAAAANFVTDYRDGAWLIMASNRRADGVLLESMIRVRGENGTGAAGADVTLSQQANDLIPKLVRGLLAHRKKGAWSNTQENVFILLALDKYFNAFEKVTPDFVTRVWLGNAYAGEQAFRGRSANSNDLTIPMSYLTEQGGAANLIFDKQGAGRLYYRIGMKYAPRNLKLEAADYGFTVIRSYEALDNADDVKRGPDGSWVIKSGARVRVRLSMIAPARRYHVALVDNLPAGLEILNPGLAVTEAVPPDTGGTGVLEVGSRSMGRNTYWWRQNWFEHQNFRDERAEAFSSLLWEGVYNYSYVARATTPGQFVVPPAKAEEMYHPETFGRTSTDMVRVE